MEINDSIEQEINFRIYLLYYRKLNLEDNSKTEKSLKMNK